MIFFKRFQKYKEIVHGVLERKDGSVNPFSNPKSPENILRALKKLGFKEAKIDNLIFAEQIHSKNVYICPPGLGGYIRLQTDGLISKNPGQILIVKTADCLPLLIYDPEEKKVGAIHAGRRGLIKGIIENALKAFDSHLSSLIIGIAPHIRKCCYYLKDQDYILHSQWKKYTKRKNDKFYFDLTQIALDKFLESGVKRENIEDCEICTYCQAGRFYSARKKESQPDFYQRENERFPCFGSFIGLLSKS